MKLPEQQKRNRVHTCLRTINSPLAASAGVKCTGAAHYTHPCTRSLGTAPPNRSSLASITPPPPPVQCTHSPTITAQ